MSVVVPIDDYSPIFQGDTANPFIVQIKSINGDYEDLTGSTITMKMQNVDDPSIIKTCNGPWTISGTKASYAYQTEDVDTVGEWKMWVKVVQSNGTVHPDDGKGEVKVLEINPLPEGI